MPGISLRQVSCASPPGPTQTLRVKPASSRMLGCSLWRSTWRAMSCCNGWLPSWSDFSVLPGAAPKPRAIERAKAAQADPARRGLKPRARARPGHRIADGIEANAARIAAIQSRDIGKTLRETGALAASAAGIFRYFAAVLVTADDLLSVARGNCLTMSVHGPLGLGVSRTRQTISHPSGTPRCTERFSFSTRRP